MPDRRLVQQLKETPEAIEPMQIWCLPLGSEMGRGVLLDLSGPTVGPTAHIGEANYKKAMVDPPLSRQQGATGWLLDLVEKEHPHAADAHEALCRSAPSAATLDHLKELGRPCVEEEARH